MLGYKSLGSGEEKVLVMHDWSCDCTSYDPMMNYLDISRFTFVFADLRGYGSSKELTGSYNVDEASADILELADHLAWEDFNVVGHSMTGMVAQYLLVAAPSRVKSVVAITPVPACGSPMPEETLRFAKSAALDSTNNATELMHMMSGNCLTDVFASYKANRWWNLSLPEARAGYLTMFTGTNFADRVMGNGTPVLVVLGAKDPSFGHELIKQTFMKWFDNCEVVTVENSGHYPMQETPVVLATLIQNFLLRR